MFVKELARGMRQDGYMADHWIEKRLSRLDKKNKSGLARALGIPAPRISEVISGKRRIQPDEVAPAAAYLEMTNTDVLRQVSKSTASEEQLGHLGVAPDLPPVVSDLPGYVPIEGVLLPVGMGGGGGELNMSHDEIETLYFRERLIAHELHARPGDIKHFDVRGQSMTPVLEHGDEVLIDTRDTNPAEPGLFVLWDSDGMVCKWVQLVHQSDPPRIKVSSENKRFDPHEPLAEQCRIFGRVVWYARRL